MAIHLPPMHLRKCEYKEGVSKNRIRGGDPCEVLERLEERAHEAYLRTTLDGGGERVFVKMYLKNFI